MKIKAYVHAQYQEWSKEYEFKAWGVDMSDVGFSPCLAIHEFEFDAPPHDVLVKGTIQQYREQQKAILAKAEAQRALLDQKINELLCIEYKPQEEV